MSENFINLSYTNIDFIIPKIEVISAISCTDKNIILENNERKIQLGTETFSFFDFDEFIRKNNMEVSVSSIRTAIILKNSVIVTSADCKVTSHSWSEFSLFSGICEKPFSRFGFIACLFNKNKIHYLLDINKFLEFLK